MAKKEIFTGARRDAQQKKEQPQGRSFIFVCLLRQPKSSNPS